MSEEVLLRYVRGRYIRNADFVHPKGGGQPHDHGWTTTRELPSGRLRLVAYSPYWRVDWSEQWQETCKKTLRSSIQSIVRSLEQSAIDLTKKIQEADQKTELERKEREAAEERRRRQEDRSRVEQSFRDSRQDLEQVFEQWSNVMNVERFLVGVEKRAVDLPQIKRKQFLARLNLAREFIGIQDPVEILLSWQTPTERYQPKFSHPPTDTDGND